MPRLSEVPMGPFDSDDCRVETTLCEVIQRRHHSGSLCVFKFETEQNSSAISAHFVLFMNRGWM